MVKAEVEGESVDRVLRLPNLQELVLVEASDLQLQASVEVMQAGRAGVEEEGFSAVRLSAVTRHFLARKAVMLLADGADADLVAHLAGFRASVAQLEKLVKRLWRHPECKERDCGWRLDLLDAFEFLGECVETLRVVQLAEGEYHFGEFLNGWNSQVLGE